MWKAGEEGGCESAHQVLGQKQTRSIFIHKCHVPLRFSEADLILTRQGSLDQGSPERRALFVGCMYVCACECVHCLCECTCVHIFVCACLHVCMCMSACACVSVCLLCVHVYVCTHACVCVHEYMCTCVHVCACVSTHPQGPFRRARKCYHSSF